MRAQSSRAFTKAASRLSVTFEHWSRPMDDDYPSPDWHEIITTLRLEAGRIMENTSVELASILPSDHEVRAARLGKDREAADDIQALLAAAQVLHRRCLGDPIESE